MRYQAPNRGRPNGINPSTRGHATFLFHPPLLLHTKSQPPICRTSPPHPLTSDHTASPGIGCGHGSQPSTNQQLPTVPHSATRNEKGVEILACAMATCPEYESRGVRCRTTL